jgi:hypothetical protein
LSEETTEAVSTALQKAALLQLAGAPELEGKGDTEGPEMAFYRNIRGGKFIVGRAFEH